MPDPVFHTTKWSLVLAIRTAENDRDRSDALTRLCELYWFPVFAYLRRDHSSHDAEDLTQGFFAHVLERKFFEKAQSDKGYFRGFLRGALKRYVLDRRDYEGAARRGGKAKILPLDAESGEVWMKELSSRNLTPAEAYERAWAETVLERAMSQLEREHVEAGKLEQFLKLKPFISAKPGEGEYEAIARELSMTKGNLGVIVYRLGQRLGEFIRIEVSETVERPEMVEIELNHLIEVLRK